MTREQARATAAIGATLAALLVPLAILVRPEPPAPPATPPTSRELRLEPVPALDAASSRDLFAAGSESAATSMAPGRESPDLVGVIGRIGRDAVALVRGTDGHSRSIAVGATSDGWRLDAIGRDAVLFSKGGVRRRVELPASADEAPSAEAARDEDQ